MFPESTMIAVNGIELEVFEAGRENAGNPIVLCHGWPELAYSWRHQVPALVVAGYHVIAPNQRGFGRSSGPAEVTEFDLDHLAGDLVGLLDHYGYADATFVGHDWGAIIVWGLTLLQPDRVNGVIALSVPYQLRGDVPWVDFIESILGSDFYYVHFNKQPGVADAVLDANTERFLRNLFRVNQPLVAPEPGNGMMNLALQAEPTGDPLMSDAELAVYVESYEASGFTGGINWYRNSTRNWHRLADVDPIVHQPALVIYGDRDVVPRLENMADFVPNVEVVSLDSGHCIQQERPEETTRVMLEWLGRQGS